VDFYFSWTCCIGVNEYPLQKSKAERERNVSNISQEQQNKATVETARAALDATKLRMDAEALIRENEAKKIERMVGS
jgi:hypothetical protein